MAEIPVIVSAPVAPLEQLLLDAVPLCVLAGPDHRFERANERFRSAFPRRDLDGRPFRDVFPDLADTEVFWILDDVWSTGEPAVANEVRATEVGGGEAYLNFVLQPVRDRAGDIAALLAIGVDVTPQVEARRRVEALERRSAFLAEASATLASSLEPAETLATVAHLAVHHFADWCAVDLSVEAGMGPGTVAAADPDLEDILAEAQARYPPSPTSECLAGRVLKSSEPQLLGAGVAFATARDERHRQLLARIAPSSALAVPLKARGQTLGVLTLAWVHGGHQYRGDDLALADEFARHAAIAVDNARLYREAQAAIQVREEFLGIAGHELRTPLTALKLQLQSLQRASGRLAPPRLDRVGDRLLRMSHQITRLERLMSDLLDVSMVSAGRLNLRRERTDLRAVVADVIARQQENLTESGSSVMLDAPEAVIGLFDPQRIDQVVQNLLTNAIKYGRGQPIRVELREQGIKARLTVRDRGIGIAPEAQGRIFGRFERAVSNRHYGGFGLGLWIVRQIVDASGGRIWFDSVPDQGTTFVVELPLEP
jgi:signal transduction histidine kinase